MMAALGSLATTDIECPRSAALAGGIDVESNAVFAEHYVVMASNIGRVHLTLRGTSTSDAEVRVRFAPDDPALFVMENDGGAEQSVALALRPGTESTADLKLPYCRTPCSEVGVSVVVEHLNGSTASLGWDVVVETESCDREFHAEIERR